MMIGAYASGYLTVNEGWPPLVALLAGMMLAAVIALGLGRIIFRLRGFYLSMASLGLLMIGLTFAREWTEVTGGPSGLVGIGPLTLFGWGFASDRAYYFVVLGVALLVLLFCLSITRSRLGRALLAIRSNESAARACGIDTVNIKMRIFAVSAAVASLAGSLYVHYLTIANPAPFGIDTTIAQLTALTAGGFLSLWGSFAGAAMVVAIPLMIAMLAGSTASQLVAGLQLLIFGLLLIVIVIAQAGGHWRRLGALAGFKLRPRQEAAVAQVDTKLP
jgi:branched-chain amino acid transport system permease protein